MAYHKNDLFEFLKQTLEAWEQCDWAEVRALELKPNRKFEVERRVLADNLASGGHYILADLGCVPADEAVIRQITKRIGPADGLIGLGNEYSRKDDFPAGVRVVSKGIVTKWPQKFTDTYNREHAEAVKLTGKKVETWPDITWKPIQAS